MPRRPALRLKDFSAMENLGIAWLIGRATGHPMGHLIGARLDPHPGRPYPCCLVASSRRLLL
jgi:hypothetical protein